MSASRKLYSPFDRWAFGWIPFWAVTIVIVRGAVMPPQEIPKVLLQINDKLIHATEFFVMMIVAYQTFSRAHLEKIYRHRFADAILYSLFLGALTECLQFFAPGRSPDIFDFLADSAGALIAAGIVFLSRRVLKESERV